MGHIYLPKLAVPRKRLNNSFEFHPVRNPAVRMNGVCPYFTMYPLKFPFARLGSVKRGTRVLDPFCGRGTTNFAARLQGLAICPDLKKAVKWLNANRPQE